MFDLRKAAKAKKLYNAILASLGADDWRKPTKDLCIKFCMLVKGLSDHEAFQDPMPELLPVWDDGVYVVIGGRTALSRFGYASSLARTIGGIGFVNRSGNHVVIGLETISAKGAKGDDSVVLPPVDEVQIVAKGDFGDLSK